MINWTLSARLRRLVPLSRKSTSIRLLIGLLVVALLFIVTAGCQRVRDADTEYEAVLDQIDGIQERIGDDELYSLTPDDMAWLEHEFTTIVERVETIEKLSTLPFGINRALEDEDSGSARFRAMSQMLEVSRLMAESGQVIANIGYEALDALERNGFRSRPAIAGDTWLDVLQRREGDLNDALEMMDEAMELRESIDDEQLPGRVQSKLGQIDGMIERFGTQRELADDLPLAFETLGAEAPVRYLVLFQNPAEMRPTGGFVGTIAFVDVERGQILDYAFHDVYDISLDYQRNVEDPVELPWALERYVRTDYLQYQDANWWANFPDSAEMLMKMTEDAGWPAVDAVVAVQPDAVGDLISLAGPITIEVDGAPRRITASNLHEESERQRRLEREGDVSETDHKEVIGLIGEILLDELSDLERDQQVDGARAMFSALDRRDMQAYSINQEVQEFLEERNWAGLLRPDAEVPTLAAVFANVTGLKTSLAMQPSLQLELSEPDASGTTTGTMTIALEHLGSEDGDPFYEGFQRWWLDVVLPDGANLVDSTPVPSNDPNASNGGAYVIALDVGTVEEVTVQFTLDELERFLIRRQPGLLDLNANVTVLGCEDALTFSLSHDVVVVLNDGCPVIEDSADLPEAGRR